MRIDFGLIEQWVAPNSRVLDLGCGDGTLLRRLEENRAISGIGLEIDPTQIAISIGKGLHVIQQDLDKGLSNFETNSFETVVMTQTLQAVKYPHLVLDEMLRVGKECIITFPNFGHWMCRTFLGTRGRMPVSKFMPYTWYDTPNIHFCTIKDFEALCEQRNINVLHRVVVNPANAVSLGTRLWPNLFGLTAIYHVSR